MLNKFDYKDIDRHVKNYIKQAKLPNYYGNLFDLVINNYLFATLYSDDPKSLVITETEAKLIFNELIIGSINAEELTTSMINEFNYDESRKYELEVISLYKLKIQKLIDSVRENGRLGELFIITFQSG